MITKPVTMRELADRLGITVATLYSIRGRLHADDGLPAALSRHRPYKFDRASIDAWFTRHHPLAALRAPANDDAPLLADDDVEAWRAALSTAYGSTASSRTRKSKFCCRSSSAVRRCCQQRCASISD